VGTPRSNCRTFTLRGHADARTHCKASLLSVVAFLTVGKLLFTMHIPLSSVIGCACTAVDPWSRVRWKEPTAAAATPAWDKERDVVGFVPKEMFFTKGVGKHREKLTSFELALRSAGIAACNLVRVSSIFPPKCKILSRGHGMKRLEPGQVTFVVMSEAATREP